MKNDLLDIAQRFYIDFNELKYTIGDDNAELAVIDSIIYELFKELGQIEKPDEVRKALFNLYLLGCENKKNKLT
jgi:hypothetical protein